MEEGVRLPDASRCRLSLAVVGCRRVPGQLPQKRASTGRAKPSRQAAVMERGSVGQTFLSARAAPRRQECPRHSGGSFWQRRASTGRAKPSRLAARRAPNQTPWPQPREGRASARPRVRGQADACPPAGSPGSTGSSGSAGARGRGRGRGRAIRIPSTFHAHPCR
jgi:hypothetical protein